MKQKYRVSPNAETIQATSYIFSKYMQTLPDARAARFGPFEARIRCEDRPPKF